MYSAQLFDLPVNQEVISAFSGYCHQSVIPDNCFYNEENMGGDAFPMLSPRNKRAFFNVSGDTLNGLFAKNKICYINNGTLYYGGEAVQGLVLPEIQGERQFVSMGARLLIFPDKLYVNTADLSDYGSLEAAFESAEGVSITCSLARGDGDLYEGYSVSATEPESPENADLWLDTSATPNVLKQYYEPTGMWMPLAETFVRISGAGIGKGFKLYDGVNISGILNEALNGSHIIRDLGEDFITVTGIISEAFTQTQPIRAERLLPQMDYICESGNRLWGCNSEKNEIYASKLGDPTNFNCFMGISTDSYAVSVGSDGEFTAATAFRGYVIFFKENCAHKLYGTNPPFSLSTSYMRGVQKGSSKSLCCVNERLYYKSPNGVCAFEGGVPICISEDLGSAYYTDGVAGVLGDRYYICMSDKNGIRHLFTYDELRSIWHREDEIDIRAFATHNYNLYFIARIDGVNRLCLADGENLYGNFTGELSGFFIEDDIYWSCETGLWGIDFPENKYYSGIAIRLEGEGGSKIKVEYEVDSDGIWREMWNVRAKEKGSFTIPLITPRCDHIRFRISGTGRVRLFSLCRRVELGSELNV